MSSGFSKACCTLPPIEADYTPKGAYSDIAGFKSYVVGPEDAKSAILTIYDVFGFTPQALQDLLASQGFRVVMPDLTKGDFASPDMFGPSEESQNRKKAWFSQFPGAFHTQAKPVADVAKALKSAGYSSIGALGFCWGYKVLVLSDGIADFSALASPHPTSPEASDAEKIHVPLALLPSKDENMSIINKIHEDVEAKNPGKNFLKHYSDFNHGFAAARADLKDPKQADAFHSAFTEIAEFFKAHL